MFIVVPAENDLFAVLFHAKIIISSPKSQNIRFPKWRCSSGFFTLWLKEPFATHGKTYIQTNFIPKIIQETLPALSSIEHPQISV